MANPVSWLLLKMIRGYQLVISPHMPPTCRFVPSCSEYGYEAIERHGALRGGWMATKRILRCNPLSKGGHDPVP
jgi:putative membrane protein insertion efficiency factor